MVLITNKKIVYINSNNRQTGTHSNFSYFFDLQQDDSFDKVVVLQMLIPKTYYLIEDGYNTFQLQESTTTISITVTPGNYNRNSFATVIGNLLTAASPNGWTYSVSYPNGNNSADTGHYTFTVSGNSSQPSFIFQNYIYEQLGFDSDSTNLFSGNTLSSTNVIKLQAEDALYLHSSICSNGNDNILQEVFVANGSISFSNVTFQNSSIEGYSKQFVSTRSNVYTFYLTDENDVPIDTNGQNIVITLLLYKTNETYRILDNFLQLATMKLSRYFP